MRTTPVLTDWEADPFADTETMEALPVPEAVPEPVEDSREKVRRMPMTYMIVTRRRWK